MIKATAHFDGDSIVISIEDQEVRRVVPKTNTPYKFNYNNEEYHFIYEEKQILNKNLKQVFFYPLGEFTKNNIFI